MFQPYNKVVNVLKVSLAGRIIHVYFRVGKIVPPLLKILTLIALVTTVLVLFCPQFAMNKEGFNFSSGWLGTAQGLVGVLFLVSYGGIFLLAALACIFIWPEMIIEMRLKKKATRIVKERKKITIPDLAAELRLREDDLGVLVKTWTAGGGGGYKIVGKKLIGGKMSLDLTPPGVLTWNE